MQPGQPFGPFTLDKKLGAGAMGVVWRATYTKTGQRVAIKIMMPNLGDENSNAIARFEREAAILKQLNHPNIVRLFGIGKYKGHRYYAMEYIEGESLDRLMSRRDRMTWEEVVTLGRQLCGALQHAHEAGVIHRDLKPSNLMIDKYGTLKLTDFGIAKDMDVTQLTEANCTVGTASYMSPEQCRGERNLSARSDLYSLGIVFYELLTGDKPFKADNAMEMFMLHVNGKLVRPSKRVLDLPVWFDNLIVQLMEKKPEQRPVDAAMVAGVLETIEEKVQTLQSAGVDVATRRRGDKVRKASPRTAEDREIARELSGKPKRKTAEPRLYQRWWFVAAGVVSVVSLMGLVLFLAIWLWPRSATVEDLYKQAKPLMESNNPDEDWAKALDPDFDGPLYRFERYHAKEQGEHADQMRRWAAMAHESECDKMVRKYLSNKKKNLPYESHGPDEENAFAAGLAEEEGDLQSAAEHWAKVKEAKTKQGWIDLAEDRLKQLADVELVELALRKHLDNLKDLDYEPKLSEQQQELAQGLRYQVFGDHFRAYQEFALLREKYAKNPEQRFWYLLAAKKAKELKPASGETDDNSARLKRLKSKLEEANNWLRRDNLAPARIIYLDIIALYGGQKDDEIQNVVSEAKLKLDEVTRKSPKNG